MGMGTKYSKGYYKALEKANGDESKIANGYGWYVVDSLGPEYDDEGEPIAFT